MADIKISQLGAAVAVVDADVIPATANGVTVKVPASVLKEYAIGGTDISSIGDGTPTGAISALKSVKIEKTDIAPIETSVTSKAYAVGDQLYYNGMLYSVIAAIAQGETLVVDTNIELSDKVTEQIKALNGEVSTLKETLAQEVIDRNSAILTAVGSEASTRAAADTALDTRIDQIVAPSGEAPSAAEVTDGRLTINGISASAIGNAIRGQVNQNVSSIAKLGDALATSKMYEKPIPFEVVTGRFSSSGFNSNGSYCRITKPIAYKNNCSLRIEMPSGNSTYLFNIFKYVSDSSGILFVNDRYDGLTISNWESGAVYYINFMKTRTPNLTQTDIDNIVSNIKITVLDKNNIEFRSNIGDGADLDLYVETGKYLIASANISHAPLLSVTHLEIKHLDSSGEYIVQTVYSENTTYNVAFATRTGRNTSGVHVNNGTGLSVTWTAWNYSGSKSANYKVLCLGDSIFGLNRDAMNSIPANIAKYTPVKECINGALGGTRATKRSSGVFQYYDFPSIVDALISGTWTDQEAHTGDSGVPYYFASAIATLKALDMTSVDVLILNYGGNDYTAGVLLGEVEDTPDTDTLLGCIQYQMQRLYTAFPNLKIVVATPPYKFFMNEQHEFVNDGDTAYFNSEHETLADMVDGFPALGKKFHTPVIDLYNGLGINRYNTALWFATNDGSHPSDKGCRLTAKFIAEEINRL